MTFASLRSALAAAAFGALALLGAGPALADGKIYTSWGVAIDGTDPVSYFTEGKPVEGSRDITADWNGATWRFASAANRDMFLAEPEKFAPQYGGYCA
jgi:YHS domain-containing protein